MYYLYHTTNWEGGFKLLQRAAEANDARALFELSRLYFEGRFVKTNHNEFWRLVCKASDRGCFDADVAIAQSYLLGVAADTNRAGAFEKCRRAAESDFGPAQHVMGLIAMRGANGPTNFTEAVHWFERTATHYVPDAAYQLALLYGDGLGTAKDVQAAAKWMELGARLGSVSAEVGYALLLSKGIGVPRDAAKSLEWTIRAAIHGNVIAQCNLGNWYAHRPVSPDLVESAKWYELASLSGNQAAKSELDRLLPNLAP